MDRIVAHGIELRRLAHADIEMVRQWRNDDSVRRYMEVQETITPAMQERWFTGLDPQRQYFYVVVEQGCAIGLANLKNLDAQARCAEGGIFIADEGRRDGTTGLAALLALYDFGFGPLALQQITAHIRQDNARAIRFNQAIGFRLDPGQETVRNQLYRLAREDYLARTAKFRRLFERAPPS